MVGLYRDGFEAAGPHKISLDSTSPARTLVFVMIFATGKDGTGYSYPSKQGSVLGTKEFFLCRHTL